jgi:translation initiation factor 1
MTAKKRDGIVYSTNPDFEYNEGKSEEQNTLPPAQQMLYLWIDSKGRNGKTVTLIKNFVGKDDDLEELAGAVKKYCGTGGSVKNREIIIQGDFRDKIASHLSSRGYKFKKAGR